MDKKAKIILGGSVGASLISLVLSLLLAVGVLGPGESKGAIFIPSQTTASTISSTSSLTLQAAAAQNLNLDAGGNFLFRDQDNSDATVSTIASGTGYARFGDSTAPTVSLEAANGLTVAAGGISITAPGSNTYGITLNQNGDAGLKLQDVNYPSMDFFTGATRRWSMLTSGNELSWYDRVNNKEGVNLEPNASGVDVEIVNIVSQDTTRATVDGIKLTTEKVTVLFSGSLFDAAGLTDSANVWQQPANSILLNAKVVLNTQFAATGMTDLDVTVGDAGNNAGILNAAMNLTSDATTTQYKTKGAYFDATAGLLLKETATQWIAYSTAVGANLSTLTAGSVSFYFTYIQL